jgi:hypothetical protein
MISFQSVSHDYPCKKKMSKLRPEFIYENQYNTNTGEDNEEFTRLTIHIILRIKTIEKLSQISMKCPGHKTDCN